MVTEDEIVAVLSDCPDITEEALAKVRSLLEERDELASELDEVRASRDELETELETRDGEAFNVLRSVRDWFDNVILLQRPMSDPRVIWKKVEKALEQ